MSKSLRDFLNWFEGYAENLDGTPNPKQWERLKERLLELKAIGAEQPTGNGHMQIESAAEPIGGAHTTERWRQQVMACLEEEGFDPASAAEVLATIPVDLNAEPEAVAKRAAHGFSQ